MLSEPVRLRNSFARKNFDLSLDGMFSYTRVLSDFAAAGFLGCLKDQFLVFDTQMPLGHEEILSINKFHGSQPQRAKC